MGDISKQKDEKGSGLGFAETNKHESYEEEWIGRLNPKEGSRRVFPPNAGGWCASLKLQKDEIGGVFQPLLLFRNRELRQSSTLSVCLYEFMYVCMYVYGHVYTILYAHVYTMR